jgi:hypothetical protein
VAPGARDALTKARDYVENRVNEAVGQFRAGQAQRREDARIRQALTAQALGEQKKLEAAEKNAEADRKTALEKANIEARTQEGKGIQAGVQKELDRQMRRQIEEAREERIRDQNEVMNQLRANKLTADRKKLFVDAWAPRARSIRKFLADKKGELRPAETKFLEQEAKAIESAVDQVLGGSPGRGTASGKTRTVSLRNKKTGKVEQYQVAE